MKNKYYAILILVLLSITCQAQCTNVLNINFTNWGESIDGVRPSVVLSNNIVTTNSYLIIFARMTNSSTNLIYMGESIPEYDFEVSLIDASGKIYKITQMPVVYTALMLTTLNPQESRDWIIQVRANKYFVSRGLHPQKKDVPPGDYTLKVTRQFTANKSRCDVVSNLL